MNQNQPQKNIQNNWPLSGMPKLTEFSRKLLMDCQNISKPIVNEESYLNEVIANSHKFPLKFPINSCRIETQPKERLKNIQKQVASVYPLIHERVLWLFLMFLEHKLCYGNNIEKNLYANMSLTSFVQRLLDKRAVVFYGSADKYLLLNGERGASGFVPIGTEDEKAPLTLKDCLSYDEIKLAALLSVSSFSEFINNGTRTNMGVVERNKWKIEESGVIIGIIGARLSRKNLMEYQDIVISKSQNTIENGYGTKSLDCGSKSKSTTKQADLRKVWNNFYEEKDFLFSEVKKDFKRFDNSRNKQDIFDNLIMRKRYSISFDTLLLESEFRAASENKLAYIHVVGIGLGVWRVTSQQERIFLETFEERINALLPRLKHIGFIHFSWFSMECGNIKNGACIISEDGSNSIKIFVSNRNPADKLPRPEFENTLLIVSYAWDGNALPGNEFWLGMLKSSGDPAAACSTLITEIHNPHINRKFVSGDNLHIASIEFGVIHLAEYAKKILHGLIKKK